jgi:ankyrin repeat protein
MLVSVRAMHSFPHSLHRSDCDIDLMRVLCEEGVDIRCRDADGNTPLHAAARSGDIAKLHVLLSHHADPIHSNNFGALPLAQCLRKDAAAILLDNVLPDLPIAMVWAGSSVAIVAMCEHKEWSGIASQLCAPFGSVLHYLITIDADVSLIAELASPSSSLTNRKYPPPPFSKNFATKNTDGTTPLGLALKFDRAVWADALTQWNAPL